MVQAPVTSCVNHRRRDRVASCGMCGNPLCGDCIVHTPVGVKCRNCTGARSSGVFRATDAEAAPDRGERARRPPKETGDGDGARRRPVALLAAGVVILALAAFGLASRRSGSGSDQAPTLVAPSSITERPSEFVGAGGQRLNGSLTLPGATTNGQKVPAVLIVGGLGALDRNAVATADTPDATRDALVSGVSGIGLGTVDPLYADLSLDLARAGVATFRYDKRGTSAAKLRGDQKLSFDDEVADARAALDFLLQRQEVGGSPVAVVGHDIGAVVAMRAAAGNPRVKAIVAVSTPARPLVDVVTEDLRRTRGSTTSDQFRAAVATMQSTGKPPAADTLPELLRPVFSTGQEAYLTSVLSLDPAAEAAKVGVPVLLVRGGADASVTSADTDRLVAALRSGSEVLVGAADSDHNLTLADPGHVHSNTAGAPTSRRDAAASTKLATWVKIQLSS